MAENEKTSIAVGVDLKDWLVTQGVKNESYDEVLRRLLSAKYPGVPVKEKEAVAEAVLK